MNAVGWDLVDPALAPDPLRGDERDYVAAAHHADAVAAALGDVARRLHALAELPDETAWSGSATGAMLHRIAAVATAVSDGPSVLAALAAACRAHADALADLRRHSDAALVRAHAELDALTAARAQLADARGALSATEQQLASALAWTAPPDQFEVELLERRRAARRAAVLNRHAAVAERAAELAATCTEHAAVAEAEADLVGATAAALRGLAPATAPVASGVPVGTDGDAPPGNVFASMSARIVALAERVMDAAFEQLAGALAAHLLPFSFDLGLGIGIADGWTETFSDLPRRQQLAVLAFLGELHRGLTGAPREGDADGTYDWSPRGHWPGQAAGDGDPVNRASWPRAGTATVASALELLRDSRTLAPDEFGVVALANGRTVVVLPGVTDLSRPDFGWNATHRSVRDVDEAAYGSLTSTSIGGNRYAQMVAAGLAEFGVDPGAELLLVGHSFGADTALDLAADPRFNGAGGYRVTHVVAAGYYSQPQLPYVPSETEVLVLQNDGDLAIALERFAEYPAQFEHHATDGWGDVWDGDAIGAVGALSGAANAAVGFGGYLAEQAAETGPAAPLADLPGIPWGDPEPRVTTPAEHVVVARFDGPDAGFGHHPDNYVDYLEQLPDPAVAGFGAGLVAAGYTGPGRVYAIDVSVPREGAGRGSW